LQVLSGKAHCEVNDTLQQIGLAGVIIYIVFREVFPFVLKMRNGNGYSNPLSDKAELVSYGELRQKVTASEKAILELTRIVTETTQNVQILTGNVSTLTEIIKKRR
jgi:hypothetical protein